MLYTLSKAQYDKETLSILNHITENDTVVLWQDGVLQAVKNPQFFANLPRCYLLEQDVTARGLQQSLSEFRTISLAECVKLTERYFPQIAM
ncbi:MULTISPECIES: sulfurtransferase complex subunit TusB [unclassified Mannheimia]|uniref:sulfurtransferase complex subunit TusB n=1 Tax=unclassified Mannheimia TaxID=2645054 RepID=UPI00359DE407